MQAKHYFHLLKSGIVTLFFLSCGNEVDLSKQRTEKLTTSSDSIEYWLSEEVANTTNQEHASNLKKAFQAIKNLPSDTLKARFITRLTYNYFILNDTVNFRTANALDLELGKRMNDTNRIAGSFWDKGDFLFTQNKVDSAYFNYNKAQNLYLTIDNNFFAARMLYNMASTQITIKDFTAAEVDIIDAIELFKPLNENGWLYDCYNTLAVIANNLKEYDKSLEYHKLSAEYLKKSDLQGLQRTVSKNNIGVVYLEMKDYSSALQEFTIVTETDSIKSKDIGLYALALSNSGYANYKIGNENEGIRQIKRAIAIKDSIQDFKSLSQSYYVLSDIYLNQNDTVKALELAQLSKKQAQESGNNLRVLETLGLLTKIDPKNATDYTQNYIQLNDSLQLAERRARNKFERIRFETNETIQENELLARQNQLWIGISAILLLLAIAAYVIIDQRRKNEKLRFQEEQQKNNQKIFSMLMSENSKLEEGKKQAQKRISEELHDAVQSRIQGIRMLLIGLNKRSTPEAIQQRAIAITELQHVQEEVRSISHELSHAAYQKINSFIFTIKELLNATEKTSGISSNFTYSEDVEWDNLNGEIKINVYRIIQESIQNSVKHAAASQIDLKLVIKESSQLIVKISDDGKGFVKKKEKKGIGMRNIDSRVTKINGKWEINSEPGKGTVVILYIPTEMQELSPNSNYSRTIQI